MNYVTGELIRVGDIITADNSPGRILVLIEEGSAVTGYNSDEWTYLGAGIMLETEQAGPVHWIEPDEVLVFIRRASYIDATCKQPGHP